MANKEFEKRLSDLSPLNMKLYGDQFIGKSIINEDFNISIVEIKCDSDEEWDTKISKMQTELNRRKA